MENKKAKVSGAVFKKEGTGQYGQWYAFAITMDNGDQGDYLSKTRDQNYFEPGKIVEYEIGKDNNGYWKIKPIRAQGAGFKVNPVFENKRVALKCSVQLAAADKITIDSMRKYYDNFLKLLNEG